MHIDLSYYSEKGSRSDNEDAVSLLESCGGVLAIVADGLGGHADGALAASRVVTVMNQMLHGKRPSQALLQEAIRQASREIYENQKSGKPMHSTVAALWMDEKSCLAAHVGDSRIYQLRDDRIVFRTMDHSIAQMAVLIGEMEEADIRGSRDRNKLIRVLGTQEAPRVDICPLSLCPGDRLLICSDGFWENVTENIMLETMQKTDTARSWLAQMRRHLESGEVPARDNHSAVVWIING